MSAEAVAHLEYDADCGFCTRCAHLAERLGLAVRPTRGLDEVRWVEAERTLGGHEAVAAALRHTRLRPLGALIGSRALAPVARRTYALVARNRYRLPGSDGTCRR